MNKKRTIIISLVIILYVIIVCLKLFQLGLNILRIDSNAKHINTTILNEYQEEIKEGLKNADINIPEQARITSIVYYINWNDDVFSIQYENNGKIEQIRTVGHATMMPELVMNNLEKQDKQEQINIVKKNIVEFAIILVIPVVSGIIYYISKKYKVVNEK